MPELPAHTDTGDAAPGTPPRPGRRRRTAALIAAGIAVVAVFVVLHLTGVVGAESHG